MDSPLDAKLASVLGGRTASAFERGLGLTTVGDLLSHYPRRYAKRGELTALTELPLDTNVTIVAEVVKAVSRSMQARRGSILEVTISDGTGILTLTFFNQKWRENELKPGVRGIFAGKVGAYRGNRQLAHPDYELFDEDADPAAVQKWAELPIPIYPATSTVASWQIQKAVAIVLDSLGELEDPIPQGLRTERKLVSFRRALDLVHRPTKDSDWGVARATLRFQEAFVLQAALLRQRERLRETAATSREPGDLLATFDAELPFELTGDQRAVGEEVSKDLAAEVPMNRLIQGEVGSGKTLVALRAMLAVAESGGQSALLAPTEVLAHQHLRSIVRTLGPDRAAALRPTILTGQLTAAERRKALLAIVSGSARIVVGTHALLGDAVTFFDLGLVVVDEQHRFGVEQREALRVKAERPPHVLVLTATPIPRTVAMTVFGDLDVSTIRELPAGRQPITSHVVPLAERPGWMGRVWERLSEELEKGHQGFVVCPAIDSTHSEPADAEPDALEGAASGRAATVTETLAALRADPLFAGRRIEVLHGRLSSDDKDSLMRAFAAGDIDVLVSTTVIEVGVDVPNASAMVVLDADRFGVSQLHQLRGRVGRGSVPGLCLLVTGAEEGSVARERVEAVASTLDGFELAGKDLELRQEGDVLGSTQSGGRSSLRLVRVTRDGDLIAEARELAAGVLAADPRLDQHPALRDALDRRLDAEAEAYLAKN
ncbi:ATP-dependent DNA helicase RecG [Microbacteriaceae bacterium SG_E_30_P1]|uniref:Probable DNA 3'-5' helicase RecG n=1 Tax=Antiquaquibacter oligotrophicus TaxID=2880260 RepID=A0ABT6KQJ8_9MICO|nr:ATP-dependent DNA helicase RecG [Antiquaquibacter oligotrophicus]MDH6181479.1 ATP-dependent DNA helicase RecG [Antiquaquibacter oligotrophicus]UDF12831.1 ATP-dependent DNA helicase RecG [Antiquaquibacter oligotrophicus]